MDNAPYTVPPVPEQPPTPAELDAMSPFERFKWLTRHALSAPKEALTNPFAKHHQTTEPSEPPHTAE